MGPAAASMSHQEWVVIIGSGSWASCHGWFSSYDAAIGWVRANQFTLDQAQVYPVLEGRQRFMGQAYDADGRVLGEAEGASMKEVLEKLERAHPEAERIELLRRRAESLPAATTEKEVRSEDSLRRAVEEGQSEK